METPRTEPAAERGAAGASRRRGAVPLGHVGYWAAAAAVATMGWALYAAAVNMRESAELVDRKLQVLERIAAANAGVSRAEAAHRGFLLFGEDRFVIERDRELGVASAAIEDLARYPGQSASHPERVRALWELVEQRARVMREAEMRLRSGESDVSMVGLPADRIQSGLAALRGDQLLRLEQLRQGGREAYDNAIFVIVGAMAVLLGVLLPAYVGFMRESRGRQRAERLVTSLANTVPGALVQYRLYPDGSSRYEYLSEGTERLRGFSREAALADPEVVLGSILEGDREALIQALTAGAREQKQVQFDYRARGPHGAIRWYRTTAAPRRSADGSTVFSAYWADVTDQKSLERDLREARDAAEAATRAKSTFLATMSHEIRTPMNGVLGMLELLGLGDLNREQRATLAVIRESAQSLLRIIDDILDFSKIEAGKLELRPEAASVAEVVERVRNIYAGNASSKGLVLRHYCDARISPAVIVDPVRLQQILSNLVSNAIKFTAEGEVEIRADLLAHGDGEDLVRFTVSDTGVGIPEAERERLFKPFSQVAGEAQAPGGTGLGLSISQRLARMMGGSIALDSQVDVGTVMELTLPLPVAELPPGERPRALANAPESVVEGRRAAPPVESAAAEGTLLLVVDDHPINRMVLMRQVHALGYAAEAAENGLEAVDLWSTGRFAAIITDCHMPEMNGYDLARHIRAVESRHGHPRTPILACTANALGGEAENCLAAGMDDYLAKPIELERLARKLDQWVPLPQEGAQASEAAPGPAPAPQPIESEPIDPAALAEITEGDAALERDILGQFRAYNAADVTDLMNAIEAGEPTAIAQCAHRIKGAARTIGALGLAAAAERVERAGREGEAGAARSHLGAFVAELDRLEAHLDRMAVPAPHAPAAAEPSGAALGAR